MKSEYHVLSYSSGAFDDGRRWAKVVCHGDEVEQNQMFNGLHVFTFPVPSENVTQLDSILKGNVPGNFELSMGMTVKQGKPTPTVVGVKSLGSSVTPVSDSKLPPAAKVGS